MTIVQTSRAPATSQPFSAQGGNWVKCQQIEPLQSPGVAAARVRNTHHQRTSRATDTDALLPEILHPILLGSLG